MDILFRDLNFHLMSDTFHSRENESSPGTHPVLRVVVQSVIQQAQINFTHTVYCMMGCHIGGGSEDGKCPNILQIHCIYSKHLYSGFSTLLFLKLCGFGTRQNL